MGRDFATLDELRNAAPGTNLTERRYTEGTINVGSGHATLQELRSTSGAFSDDPREMQLRAFEAQVFGSPAAAERERRLRALEAECAATDHKLATLWA
jgi:hypothetical protein